MSQVYEEYWKDFKNSLWFAGIPENLWNSNFISWIMINICKNLETLPGLVLDLRYH